MVTLALNTMMTTHSAVDSTKPLLSTLQLNVALAEVEAPVAQEDNSHGMECLLPVSQRVNLLQLALMITLTLQPTHIITTMGILTVTPTLTHTHRIMITPPTLMGTTTITTGNTMTVMAMTLIHLVIVLNHILSWIG